jgi:Cu2+-exporting ATPase
VPQDIADASPVSCFHCGDSVPAGADFSIDIGGERRPMCCPGCRAVAGLIAANGLERFYDQRTAYNQRPEPAQLVDASEYRIYDDPQLAGQFSERSEDNLVHARLLIGGVTCAACTWLIEKTLTQLDAVSDVSLNFSQSRLDIAFDGSRLPMSELFARVAALGYTVRPWQSAAREEQARDEYRGDLRRLAVAGIGMMQVGMFAIALHAGDLQGISDEYRDLLRGFSLLVTTFVVWFSARGFFTSAWRHLRIGALVMDLPVALAIGLAWAASAYATLTGSGDVYFDSVVMFTFLLLLARFVEKRVRYRDAIAWQDAEDLLPDAVQRRQDGQWVLSARRELQAGDRVLLRAGDTVPIDGEVVDGHSAVREDTFSGEALPREVRDGDTVFAGTLNLEATLEVRATGSYADTRLAALQRSIDRAQLRKPALARLADRIAGRFIAGVLLITGVTALLWWQLDPQRALWISLAVLVISCPCALSLATPATLASAATTLRRHGVIVNGPDALERLSQCSHMVFDKTGTLTTGALRITDTRVLRDGWDTRAVHAAGAALQRHSNHPIAAAFRGVEASDAISAVRYTVGSGVEGRLAGRDLRLGSAAFCSGLLGETPVAPSADAYWICLADRDGVIAWLALSDATRPEAIDVLQHLRAQQLQLELLTGDASPRAARLGAELGFDGVLTGQSPQQKMARVAALQAQGAVVAMIGDGLNDAPVLKLADVSIAVTGATDLARAQADFVLLRGDLTQVNLLRRVARRTRVTIIQNFAWALGYNALGIPLAALGLVPPWAAALGMSLSSLLVVANSLRLRRERISPPASQRASAHA